MTVRVLMIGDDSRTEMRAVVSWVEQRTTAQTLRRARTVPEFLAQSGREWQPDLIVALESHPDEYSQGDVANLFAAAPLSRIVCCAGAWSEAAGRTRNIWPLALRIAAAAIPRLDCEWMLIENRPGESPLPPTASREEWFAAHHPAFLAGRRNGKRVFVASPDAAYRQMLGDLLTASGRTLCNDDSSASAVLIVDVDPWSSAQAAAVQSRASRCAVIAVSGWITPELADELDRAGVRAVLPKLGDHRRLLEIIENADEDGPGDAVAGL